MAKTRPRAKLEEGFYGQCVAGYAFFFKEHIKTLMLEVME